MDDDASWWTLERQWSGMALLVLIACIGVSRLLDGAVVVRGVVTMQRMYAGQYGDVCVNPATWHQLCDAPG